MEDRAIIRRELYLDVNTQEEELNEIYLYQVDFYRGNSFRNKEYVFRKPEEIENESAPDGMVELVPEEPEFTEQFQGVWNDLKQDKIATDIYVTDACYVAKYLLIPMSKKNSRDKMIPEYTEKMEAFHDCISMGRVIPLLSIDEKQHLSAEIRRRIKERYHTVADLVKEVKESHIMLQLKKTSEGNTELSYAVTDAQMRMLKEPMSLGRLSEETLAMKLNEVLVEYPEADIFINATDLCIYQVLYNIEMFMNGCPVQVMYSMTSMLLALGKDGKSIVESIKKEKCMDEIEIEEWITIYQDYLKHAEEIKFHRFTDEQIYSKHSFYFPVRIPSESAWKRQFDKNSIWQKVDREREAYHIGMTGEVKGKYTVKSDDEQFLLRITDISISRYFNDYAVIKLETENRCYPGAVDRERINKLGSSLIFEKPGSRTKAIEERQLPSALDVKVKTQGQVYAVSADPVKESKTDKEREPWLNGLFLLGQENGKTKKTLHTGTQMNRILYVEQGAREEDKFEEESLELALVRTEYLRELETALAKTVTAQGEKKDLGKLKRKQKKAIKKLYAKFRYMSVAYGAELESGAAKESFLYVEEQMNTKELKQRLENKFEMYRK